MILVCDDDEAICKSLVMLLRSHDWEARSCEPSQYLQVLDDQVSAVLMDVNLGKENGLRLLELSLERFPLLPVVMISGQSTLGDALTAIRQGAYDFLEKPLMPERLLVVLNNATRYHALVKKSLSDVYPVVASKAMMSALNRMARAAKSDMPILILGESGTGKDAAAAYIHQLSPRSAGNLVRLNCGAIPESLIESELFGHVKGAFTGALADYEGKLAAANGGTLFLDEIGDLPLSAQTKLLRFLENGEIQKIGTSKVQSASVRVVSATNKDLEKEVAEGRFRKDLYYRISTLPIDLPPLRERKEEIGPLIEYFLAKSGCKRPASEVFSEEAWDGLLSYPWPGNIRELKALCERVVIWEDGLPLDRKQTMQYLDHSRDMAYDSDNIFHLTLPYAEAKRRLELTYLQTQIRKFGSIKSAAEALGILPNNLSRRLKELLE